jgi:hypothetical protein
VLILPQQLVWLLALFSPALFSRAWTLLAWTLPRGLELTSPVRISLQPLVLPGSPVQPISPLARLLQAQLLLVQLLQARLLLLEQISLGLPISTVLWLMAYQLVLRWPEPRGPLTWLLTWLRVLGRVLKKALGKARRMLLSVPAWPATCSLRGQLALTWYQPQVLLRPVAVPLQAISRKEWCWSWQTGSLNRLRYWSLD